MTDDRGDYRGGVTTRCPRPCLHMVQCGCFRGTSVPSDQSLCENKNEHLQTAQVEVHEGFVLKTNHISFKRIFTVFAVISDHHCTQLLGRHVLIPPTSTGLCLW